MNARQVSAKRVGVRVSSPCGSQDFDRVSTEGNTKSSTSSIQQRDVLLKQRTRIEQLNSALGEKQRECAGLQAKLSNITAERDCLVDALASAQRQLHKIDETHSTQLELIRPRVEETLAQAASLCEVINHLNVHVDLLGVLVQQYVTRNQELKVLVRNLSPQAWKNREAQWRSHEQELERRAAKQERLALAAMVANRQVKEELRECRQKSENLS